MEHQLPLELMCHMVMLPAETMLLILLELSILPREKLMLSQRLMLSMDMDTTTLDTATLAQQHWIQQPWGLNLHQTSCYCLQNCHSSCFQTSCLYCLQNRRSSCLQICCSSCFQTYRFWLLQPWKIWRSLVKGIHSEQ